jgi:rare lipoprotein A
MTLAQFAGARSLRISPRWLHILRAFFILCVGFIFGCGSRHTAASRPEQAQPDTTDTSNNAEHPGTIERGSGATTKTPMTNPPGASAKRDIPASNSPMARYTEQGNASWYGIPFDGRRASNGEIYDMHKLTAAHRTLPFDTVVRVTNLSNGKSTVVRITDRGPFVDNRIIDLSMAAAQEIDSIGPGVVPVRLEILSPGIDPMSGFFTVQVGAFRDRSNAERLRERLNAEYSPIFIQPYDSPDGVFYRVRVGKVPGEDAAQHFGEQLRNREGIKPIVVRLDDGGSSGRNE